MTLEPQKIAERLGATYVAQAPVVDTGAFGMAHLAEKMKQRLDVRGGRRQGTAVGWVLSSKAPMSAETERQLIALAEKLSTSDRLVDPIQLAAQLLEEAVQKLAREKND